MSHQPHDLIPASPKKKHHPFRRALLRGLAIVMPPLLTIVLFIWAWNTIENYVFEPLETTASHIIVLAIRDVHDRVPHGAELEQRDGRNYFEMNGQRYVRLERRNQWIPEAVHANVELHPDRWPPNQPPPATATAYYHQYVSNVWLPRSRTIPLFLVLFVGLLYLLGKFVAAGIGRMIVNSFESLIRRLPVIRNVYSAVKQVTDFVFVEQEIEYTRVVAVEYPRKGIWSIGFVTGESLLDIAAAANEPVLSVLIPTSPAPVTGFTVTVRRSESVDLNITIDQAIQYIVSCGVVVPPHQLQRNNRVSSEIAAAVSQRELEHGEAARINESAVGSRNPRSN